MWLITEGGGVIGSEKFTSHMAERRLDDDKYSVFSKIKVFNKIRKHMCIIKIKI